MALSLYPNPMCFYLNPLQIFYLGSGFNCIFWELSAEVHVSVEIVVVVIIVVVVVIIAIEVTQDVDDGVQRDQGEGSKGRDREAVLTKFSCCNVT